LATPLPNGYDLNPLFLHHCMPVPHFSVSRIYIPTYICTYHNFPFSTLNGVLLASLARQ